ncbi:hypothetical protein F5984_24210 [Rudanella paleaurantiibacter]|uniref:Uncharacterized protein n=1 Tax=Rudanella paleaurantiibacter TaxID=2614655 RepID=A0A7J5TSN8_9BACT|nr:MULTISPECIES: hypothetical protein [Rudanella]KAB7726428.1 hypothetical protein F5984_24210 [Rudanella paleaurantiibacter]
MGAEHKQSGSKILDGRGNDDVQFVFVQQESVSVYEVKDSMGEVVSIVIAEGIDNPERFQARPVAEQDAMKMLALDEYYGGADWEG